MTDNTTGSISDVITTMLQGIPGVSVGAHMHRANFTIGDKVFAFVRHDGVAVKLPESRAKALADRGTAELLVMGKRTMREWVVLKHASTQQYTDDLPLFKEAVAFVGRRHL